MNQPLLQVENLCIATANKHSRKRVVNEVSFHINRGETVCLVGESGSGKSVTALSVMGLLDRHALHVEEGRILVEGEDIVQASPKRLRQLRASRIGMVFQEPMTALNPVMPVGEQIDEVLRLHRSLSAGERRKKVLEVLDAVHLPDPAAVYAAYPHQLSGGQRQRIVISMALVLEPLLLIADEPTTALDVTTQAQILLLIKELQQKQNTAVLFITHDFGVVSEISDRIIVMNRGCIVEQGSRDAILMQPAQAYTRMLVSSVPSLIPQHKAAPDGKVILAVTDLNKVYAEKRFMRCARVVHAAKDVSFTLRRGEIVGVVGESGSGKSTLARCIMRLVDPSSGGINIAGTAIETLSARDLRPIRKKFQIVFQDPYRSLNPRRRIGDSLIEGMANFGTTRQAALERAAELMRLVGLEADALQRYPHQFSGGQRQRICIARALALAPDLLVADEAVSALDVSVQAQVLALLEEIRTLTGVGILFITHDLRVAAQVCDTILVMQRGVVVESGTAQQVLTQPSHAYTRALIDAAPGRLWDFKNFRPHGAMTDTDLASAA